MTRANATSPNALERAELRVEILRLRREGHSIGEIAALTQHAKSTVHRHLKAALEDYAKAHLEDTARLRALAAARYEALLAALWSIATGGDLFAVDRVLKILEALDKLHGTRAPTRIQPHLPGTDPEDLAGDYVIVAPEPAKDIDAWSEQYTGAAPSAESAPLLGPPSRDRKPH